MIASDIYHDYYHKIKKYFMLKKGNVQSLVDIQNKINTKITQKCGGKVQRKSRVSDPGNTMNVKR